MGAREASIYESIVKRALDLMLSSVALLLALPIMCLTALAIKFGQRTSIIFVQERPGQDEEIFKLLKFKTMTDNRDAEGNLLPDEQRLTRVGTLIRSTSLDELPQLINVLKGEMSFVGPRPLLKKYLPLYDDFQRRRHEVRPGITGWAQVNGRNGVSWDERFALDVWYVDNVSILTDLRIVLRTIVQVVRGHGISSRTNVTMETFTGNS